MHRNGRRACGVAAVLIVTTISAACAALPGRGPGPATAPVAAAVGADGVARVRFDHRAAADGPPPVVGVPRGATVELVVSSDTAQRVLVPALDQVRYVTAGGTVTLRFVPAAPGPVAVVLGSGLEVGRIEVAQA